MKVCNICDWVVAWFIHTLMVKYGLKTFQGTLVYYKNTLSSGTV
jgi:hypothetical protein